MAEMDSAFTSKAFSCSVKRSSSLPMALATPFIRVTTASIQSLRGFILFPKLSSKRLIISFVKIFAHSSILLFERS
ncbi:hypothetical protein TKK_0013300 [Trichogramma kaykai]